MRTSKETVDYILALAKKQGISRRELAKKVGLSDLIPSLVILYHHRAESNPSISAMTPSDVLIEPFPVVFSFILRTTCVQPRLHKIFPKIFPKPIVII